MGVRKFSAVIDTFSLPREKPRSGVGISIMQQAGLLGSEIQIKNFA